MATHAIRATIGKIAPFFKAFPEYDGHPVIEPGALTLGLLTGWIKAHASTGA